MDGVIVPVKIAKISSYVRKISGAWQHFHSYGLCVKSNEFVSVNYFLRIFYIIFQSQSFDFSNK